MASPGVGLERSPATVNQDAAIAHKLQLEQALKSSASWFIVIAVLSLVNSVLSMAGASIRFIFGMGVTEIVDAVAHESGSAGVAVGIVISVMIAGVAVLLWNFARKGQKWAWVTGMGLYALDAVIVLLLKDFLGAAFHAYALYRMYSGFKLLPEWGRLTRQAASGTISSSM